MSRARCVKSPPMRLPTPAYPYGATVYLKINTELAGMITGYIFRPGNIIWYLVKWSDGTESDCLDMELTDVREYKTAGHEE